MGSKLGSLKTAAKRAGLTLLDYQQRRARGLKRCTACKRWKATSKYASDSTRSDKLNARCKTCFNAWNKGRPRGRADPAKQRARKRVWARVSRGTMPHPNTLPCTDCGRYRRPGGPRFEYDHPHGYVGDNAVRVEAVCKVCHGKRGTKRGEFSGG